MASHPSADQIINLYDRHATTWDILRTDHFIDRKWIDRFCTQLPARATVLDLGCGSGQPVARHLIEAGASVVGVDSSTHMLALCRERFPAQQWIHADMRSLALDRQFDAILAWNSFFHLKPEDQRRMFPIFQRHAAPGALLMFTSGPSHGEALGGIRRRNAVSREPGSTGVHRTAAWPWLRGAGSHRRGCGMWRPDGLAGASPALIVMRFSNNYAK